MIRNLQNLKKGTMSGALGVGATPMRFSDWCVSGKTASNQLILSDSGVVEYQSPIRDVTDGIASDNPQIRTISESSASGSSGTRIHSSEPLGIENLPVDQDDSLCDGEASNSIKSSSHTEAPSSTNHQNDQYDQSSSDEMRTTSEGNPLTGNTHDKSKAKPRVRKSRSIKSTSGAHLEVLTGSSDQLIAFDRDGILKRFEAAISPGKRRPRAASGRVNRLANSADLAIHDPAFTDTAHWTRRKGLQPFCTLRDYMLT
ncbi:uncharacterized protein KY384_003975 [Bacidia gigantensis]|uniref:uncharacterized protein n=1 Tax=Bacidia gigantensis TaxID=2732470 RepID=UPI001D03C8D2|nr:uncharacterized protein KY384_003975 [Bacidia gigantensis]KAG8532334.1 hypothetical protein KY384_003975 [Bacidia gigantensis]